MSELMDGASRLHFSGDLLGAEEACLQVLRADPLHAPALHLLGVNCHKRGRLDDAIIYLERAVGIDPANPDLHCDLGVACAVVGRLQEAIAHFREALRRKPDHVDAHNNLGVALGKQGCFAEAIGHYQHVLRVRPTRPSAHNNLAIALAEEGRLQEAEKHYCEAVRLEPRYATAYANRAGVLVQMGRISDAIACCHEALRLDPDCVLACVHLGELAAEGFYQFMDEEVHRMESAAAAHDSGGVIGGGRRISNEDASRLHFILAGWCDRKGEYDRAFSHYRRGNDLKAEVNRQNNVAFDRERHRQYIDEIIATFDRGFFERTRSFGLSTKVQVFIVGMPRTGTTLVEQILASHPRVVAAGERRDLNEILTGRAPYPAHMWRLDRLAALAMAEEYLDRLSRIGPEAARIVDKMPDNYLHLGSICALFPNARIIHCRRDVMDVCLSCYFQDFNWVNYATSLEDLGSYYRQYEKLMRHWREVLPLPVHEVQYEELVREPERISRGLVASCGLDWSDRCLAFHENRRIVQTASKLQVRRPIYATSIARWKSYENHLLPLQQALASEPLESAVSPSAFAGPHSCAALDELFASYRQETTAGNVPSRQEDAESIAKARREITRLDSGGGR
jgi:tetratricopeptide (TPR) repeat protein